MESFKVIYLQRFKFDDDFLKYGRAKIREFIQFWEQTHLALDRTEHNVWGLGFCENIYPLGFQGYFDHLTKCTILVLIMAEMDREITLSESFKHLELMLPEFNW